MNNTVFYTTVLILLILIGFLGNRMIQNRAAAEASYGEILEITMYHGEGCNCCIKWASYLEQNGFVVKDEIVANLIDIKADHNMPSNLASCHTAIIDGYLVEGHVPAGEIRRLIAEKPEAIGISVPGMPQGAPGMESFRPEPYNVWLIDKNGSQSVYARY